MEIPFITSRLSNAVNAAKHILEKAGYKVIKLDGKVFHLEAIRLSVYEIRKIRIVLDRVKELDKQIVEHYELPKEISKEIWLKKYQSRDFEIIIIK